SGTVSLTRAQLSMLLEGIDWRHPERRTRNCRCNTRGSLHNFFRAEEIVAARSCDTPRMSVAALPDLNVLPADALKALILAQHDQLIATREQLLSRDNEIAHLKLLIAKLQRMQF